MARAAGSEVDLTMDISLRPEKKIVKELNRYEDPDDPQRPPALPRPRQGLWAPPGPELIEPPEVLVVGLGRRLRESEAQGPRARLGCGALEALQRRYGITTYFDADVHAYMGTAKASLDKSGRAGMQRIHFLQPLADDDFDVGSAIYKALEQPGMDKAMVLFVVSDNRLPFGQLRMRSAFNGNDQRIRSAYAALGPERRACTLHVGAGSAPAAEALLDAEVGALPRVLGNAATAIEVWLSEADVGLVMRFVNRPEVYEMPTGWPYREALPAGDAHVHAEEAVPQGGSDVQHAEAATPVMEAYNLGPLVGPSPGDNFALYDLNRERQSDPPRCTLAPMSPTTALAALGERPPACEAIRIAGRRFASLARLQKDVATLVMEHEPGRHLRFQDDEDTVKSLLQYHPDADRLMEDLVAVKVDCSPVDDNTRCLWVIKHDGYEEDVSLKTCLHGLQSWLQLRPPAAGALPEGNRAVPTMLRLGPGRWTRGLRETTFERAKVEEKGGVEANK